MANGRPDVDAREPKFTWNVEAAASLDEKLVRAREVARRPGFDAEAALEVGRQLEAELEAAGRYSEFEELLEAWGNVGAVTHAWRVELALRLPGRDLKGALTTLAGTTREPDEVLRLAEWCLYRGRLAQAEAGLLAAWPWVRGDDALPVWKKEAYVARCALAGMDAALGEKPDLSREALRERLAPFARATPSWVDMALALRTGREPWTRLSPEEVLGLEPEDFAHAQLALLFSLEPELRLRQGWPWGRTQLAFPELLRLLPTPAGHASMVLRPMHLLLPEPRVVEHWGLELAQAATPRPHVHAATAFALRPWGESLHRLGLVGDRELAGWWEAVWGRLQSLPAQLAATSKDPLLVEEAHRFIRGGSPHGAR